jgi:hypothetical protein
MHPRIELFLEQWTRAKGRHAAPRRDDLALRDLAPLLPNILLIQPVGDRFAVRMAGTAVCAHFGHELGGGTFENLWHGEERTDMLRLLGSLATDGMPTLIGLTVKRVGHGRQGAELLLAPLRALRGEPPMIMACYVGGDDFLIEGDRIKSLATTSIRVIDPSRMRKGLAGAGLPAANIALRRGHLALLKDSPDQMVRNYGSQVIRR